MRTVAQRCFSARVCVGGETVAAVGRGLAAFVGVASGDADEDVAYTAQKLAGLRVFPDASGRFALPGAACLLVPNFTVCGDVRRGRRPDCHAAAAPGEARALFDELASALRLAGLDVACGVFGADMRVEVANDGPVTVLLDSRRTF